MHQFSKGDLIETTEDYLAGVRTIKTGTRGTVTFARPDEAAGTGGQLLTVNFDGRLHPVQIFSRRVKLVVETKEELFTIHEPWNLKPGDVVDTVPEPYSAAGVQVRRQVPVAPPKPLPPTTPGSFVLANGLYGLPPLPMFLSRDGWIHRKGFTWTVEALQERGFTVVHDAGAKS